MSSRDASFPATSIGRTSGSRFPSSTLSPNDGSSTPRSRSPSRTPSHESLIAHPLLSPTNATGTAASSPANATVWDNGFSGGSSGGAGVATGKTAGIGYVPYTPRHRQPHAAQAHAHQQHHTTTSPSVLVTPATSTSSSSTATAVTTPVIDATTKLQLMNLKSAAQGLGLDSASVGWGVLESLAGLSGSSSAEEEKEWKEIWNALKVGKAALVLPTSSTETLGAPITPYFVKNHVAFVDEKSQKVVTLSGLRGILKDSTLTITSTLHTQSKSFRDIINSNPVKRSAGFQSLSLPSSSNSYPTYTLPSHTEILSLPPRGSLTLPPLTPLDPNTKKPPLPPRPGASTTNSGNASTLPRPSTPSGAGGRLSALAGLFGRASSQSQPREPSREEPLGLSSSPSSSSVFGSLGRGSGSRPPSILSTSDTASVQSGEVDPLLAGSTPTLATASTVPTSTSAQSEPHDLKHNIQISAYTISSPLVTQRVLEGVWRTLAGEVEASLSELVVPSQEVVPAEAQSKPPFLFTQILDFIEREKVLPVLRSKTKSRVKAAARVKSRKEREREKNGERDRDKPQVEENWIYSINSYAHISGHEFSFGAASSTQGDGADAEADVEGEMDIEDLASRYQDFYAELEEEVRAWVREQQQAQSTEEENEGEHREEDKGKEDEKREETEEKWTRNIMERVERAVTSVGGVYERLFPFPSPQIYTPPLPLSTSDTSMLPDADSTTSSDSTESSSSAESSSSSFVDPTSDTAHDEALASRIAALTMVEFSLDDLDIDVGGDSSQDQGNKDKSSKEQDVLTVVQRCGETLGLLEDATSPREKAEVLVKAHKVLVDGLTKLPPVRLKTEREIEARAKERKEKAMAKARETTTAEPVAPDAAQVTSPTTESEGLDVAPSLTVSVSAAQEEKDEEDDPTTAVPLPRPVTPPTATSTPAPPSTSTAQSDLETQSEQIQSTLSLDTIFPLLILSIVKTNPPRLISHLLYIQRFRNRSFGGEEAYCLVNLMAVAEFVGALDPKAVLGTREGVILAGAGELIQEGDVVEGEERPQTPFGGVPIPILIDRTGGSAPGSRRASRSYSTSSRRSLGDKSLPAPPSSSAPGPGSLFSSSFTLRNRVEQQVDAISSSARGVLGGLSVSGVMDSGIGVWKSFSNSVGMQANAAAAAGGSVGSVAGLPSVSLNGVTLGIPGFGHGQQRGRVVTPALNSTQAAAPWNGVYVASQQQGKRGAEKEREKDKEREKEEVASPEPIEEASGPSRKETGFSIKSLKIPSVSVGLNIPGVGRSSSNAPAKEEEMVSVSRPASVRSKKSVGSRYGGESDDENDEDDEEEDSEDGEEEEDSEEDSEGNSQEEANGREEGYYRSDTRSIRSFGSMMSSGRKRTVRPKEKTKAKDGPVRPSLSDRLASVSSFGSRGNTKGASGKVPSPPESRRSSLLINNPTSITTNRFDTPVSSRPQSPSPSIPSLSALRLAPPNKRFLEASSVNDLRMGEMEDLLKEYKRLAEAVRSAGGFAPDDAGRDAS